jgi:hypothetical protein
MRYQQGTHPRKLDFGSLTLFLVPLLALFPLRNNDLWWHLTAGRWMVQSFRFPDLDAFSHTGFMGHWTDNEWLAQLLFYGGWRLGGNVGLILLRVVLLTTVFYLLRAFLVSARRPSMAFPAMVVAIAISYSWWEIRPSLFSLIGMLGLLIVLERARRGRDELWVLPLLFLCWANLHPGFLFGLLVLFATVAATWLERFHPRERPYSSDHTFPGRLSLWAAGSAAATLVNPYGTRVFLQQIEIAGNQRYRALLDEWAPPSVPFLLLVLIAVGGFLALRYGRVALPSMVPIVGCAVLSTTGVRFEEYFAILAVPAMLAHLGPVNRRRAALALLAFLLVGSCVVGLLPPMGSALREGGQAVGRLDAVDHRLQLRGWRNVALLATLTIVSLVYARRARSVLPSPRNLWRAGRYAGVLAGLGVVLTGASLLLAPLPNDGVELDRYPDACMAAVPAGSRAFNKLSWGGWLMWKRGLPTYIDGRCWGQPIFFEYCEARSVGGERILRDRRIDAVILPPSDHLVRSLATTSEWEQACEDGASVVYRRKGNPEDSS